MPTNVAKLVDQLVETYLNHGFPKRFFRDASHINSGSCQDFAEELCDIINAQADLKTEGYATAVWDSDMCDMDGLHCFVSFNDKFYDSECPNGVDHPADLPIYSRIEEYYHSELRQCSI